MPVLERSTRCSGARRHAWSESAADVNAAGSPARIIQRQAAHEVVGSPGGACVRARCVAGGRRRRSGQHRRPLPSSRALSAWCRRTQDLLRLGPFPRIDDGRTYRIPAVSATRRRHSFRSLSPAAGRHAGARQKEVAQLRCRSRLSRSRVLFDEGVVLFDSAVVSLAAGSEAVAVGRRHCRNTGAPSGSFHCQVRFSGANVCSAAPTRAGSWRVADGGSSRCLALELRACRRSDAASGSRR